MFEIWNGCKSQLGPKGWAAVHLVARASWFEISLAARCLSVMLRNLGSIGGELGRPGLEEEEIPRTAEISCGVLPEGRCTHQVVCVFSLGKK